MKTQIITMLLIIIVACTNNTNTSNITTEIIKTKNQTIEKHDLLMARMRELRSLKKEVLKKDSLSESTNNIIAELDLADKAMWDWMHEFKVNYEAENDTLKLIYFQDNLTKINNVKLLFDSAIVHSKQYLNQR